MKRREFMQKSPWWGALALVPGLSSCGGSHKAGGSAEAQPIATTQANPISPPAGKIPVAFVISDGAVVIDFAGPWQVFQDVWIPSRGRTMDEQMPFQLYTVGEKLAPVTTSGGMKILPNYTFANAPAPKLIVIAAQNGSTPGMLQWITAASRHTDVTMSVCTGAFILAKTGLLAGKPATTHHAECASLATQFPQVEVKRGVRFVETGNLATSGGLSSGIDLALRVVERYFGRKVAADTAYNMEYQGRGWLDPASNQVYAESAPTAGQTPCPICNMEVNTAGAPHSSYKGKTYYFCSADHKAVFDAAPEKWR